MALTRLGFTDTEATLTAMERIGVEVSSPLAPILGLAADPDLAARRLADLADAVAASYAEIDGPGDTSTEAEREELAARCRAEFLDAVAGDEGTAMRLSAVLGASDALGEHLLRHPSHWRELTDPTLGRTRAARWYLRACLLLAVGADPDHESAIATLPDAEAVDALRVEYRRLLLRLVARDLAHQVALDDVAAEISDLATGTLEAALAVARARVAEGAHTCRLAVIAMGKCGGHELNYVSDVDVVFVAEPVEGQPEQVAMRAATQLASHLIRICGDHTAEGTIWPVDANLRPEGKHGPLVRTLGSYVGYYEKWARTWEFQALLKARPVAGDAALGQAYVDTLRPLVWKASRRENFVRETQAMRRRVLEHIPAKERDRQLKLGSGGLRDVEFAVQLLQMVHGAGDEDIREPTTLSALDALTKGGYVGREDGAALHDAYAFLRSVEHRLQLVKLRRTALIPTDTDELRRLARSLGMRREPVEQLTEALREQRVVVRRLHEKLFYRPLLDSLATAGHDAALLSSNVATDRLAALGFADPAAAMRHLDAMTTGFSRSARMRRALLPAMLAWFADTPDADAGLLGFRWLSEELGGSPWYLRMLRDEGEVAQRLALVLGSSRYAGSLLRREPEGVRLLSGQGLELLGRETLQIEMLATVGRAGDAAAASSAVRAIRRRDLVRVACADLCGLVDVVEVAEGLTDLTHATLEATLAAATRAVEAERGEELPTRMALVSMGRLGGHEIAYGSDADVMFVHDPLPGADPTKASRAATAVANEMRRMLAQAGPDPSLELDAALRPEGNQGPLVRTLDSYAAYYGRWSAVWEAQALLRAEAAVGDADLCRRFTELVDPLRWPAAGLSPAEATEVRRIKARVDNERMPRGADPKMHLKLGRGALTDIEWTVQLLQMQHAHDVPGLRTTRTLPALRAAREAELVTPEQARCLEESWLWCSRARNAVVLVRGTPDDQVPREVRDLSAVSEVLGYEPGESEDMLNDLRRALRQARGAVEEIFRP
ncbi:bifunctional [glutamine synthetase] adenylyltransferase/[glutamine synthetase]-adenylyl-L-tyrosine phosphorylase [Nocardioidaceae bacterium]|nr:bifunctional [glutamine synthetase] adenylyltransferase/[glutamine synthetase]-adenylyl-L-tyrosine phosphorylase [Nocardioidaceae bacterium]